MSEIDAALRGLHLLTPDPLHAATFYAKVYGLQMRQDGSGAYECAGNAGKILLSAGQAHALSAAIFHFNSFEAWESFLERVGPSAACCRASAPDLAQLEVRDPEGNLSIFNPPQAPTGAANASALESIRLQHFAVRTSRIEEMAAHYADKLGFVVSDYVRGDDGSLRACFLRTEKLHHSLALFHAPQRRFDHLSFETAGWDAMRQWGDHMAQLRIPVVWGIGRHGPGNDTFFMVNDPDGNLVEISAELEECASDRPAGTWAHEERTLNLWGQAIMRS